MLTLDVRILIPAHVAFSVVGQDAFLLNTRSDRYFLLEKVGTRLWKLLKENLSLRESYEALLVEYDVEPIQLERDLLELLANLQEHGLVEVIQG